MYNVSKGILHLSFSLQVFTVDSYVLESFFTCSFTLNTLIILFNDFKNNTNRMVYAFVPRQKIKNHGYVFFQILLFDLEN